ncbi:MAG: small basic protein [Planctomycetes bacterium]|nr:small basic protein [Planctomycetota bacterium]MCB9934553.1 small basic protein [Planctomycetota bacterium]
MSRHPSLKTSALGSKKRSVLTRQERLEQLKIERRWKQGDNVTGLPKTRVIK